MLAINEYRTYLSQKSPDCLRGLVTFEASECDCREYFKRLLLRRLYCSGDITPRQAEVLLRRIGFAGEKETIVEIATSFNTTTHFVRQVEAKVLHNLRHPGKTRAFLQAFTTKTEFERAATQAIAVDPACESAMEDFLKFFP